MNKNKLIIITLILLLLGGIVTYTVLANSTKNSLEEQRLEMIELMSDQFDYFAPELATFVDDNKTIITSVITPSGLVSFDCYLVKNEEPFGVYKLRYDLKNESIILEELEITNPKFADEWRDFQSNQ